MLVKLDIQVCRYSKALHACMVMSAFPEPKDYKGESTKRRTDRCLQKAWGPRYISKASFQLDSCLFSQGIQMLSPRHHGMYRVVRQHGSRN